MSREFDAKNQETYNFIYYYENELVKQFKKIDKSGDGTISFGEFVEQLNSFGYPLSEQELKKSFGEHDANRDARITLNEFVAYVKKCNEFNKLMDEYKKMFKEIDVNGNGYITPAELKSHWEGNGVDLNDAFYPTIAKYFDLDNDRQINLNEYLDILTFKHLNANVPTVGEGRPGPGYYFDQKNQDTYNFIFYYENELAKQFKKIDKNNSGFIALDEFVEQLKSFNIHVSDEEIKEKFAEHDVNNDKKISLDEYIKYVKSCNEFKNLMSDFTDMFKSIDTNGNGYITPAELKAHWEGNGVDLNDDFYPTIAKYFDLDNDRQINLDEFLDILTFKHLKKSAA